MDDDEGWNGDTLTYELSVTNGTMAGPITVTDVIPEGTTYVPASATESVSNGSTSSSWSYNAGTQTLSWTGELDQGGLDVSASPLYGYFPLASLGVTPLASGCNGDCDDGGYYFTGLPPYTFNGVTYTEALVSVNGTVEAGSASLSFTSFNNQEFPDATPPNNLVAPFWRDLNQSAGGEMYVAVLSDAVPSQWTVYEWENVPHFGSTDAVTMQVWVGNDGTPTAGEIYFTYGRMDNPGAGGTVGAENAAGTLGTNYFYNGSGTAPAVGTDLLVQTLDGGTATLGFDATIDGCAGDVVIVNTGDLTNAGNSETAIAVTICD